MAIAARMSMMRSHHDSGYYSARAKSSRRDTLSSKPRRGAGSCSS